MICFSLGRQMLAARLYFQPFYRPILNTTWALDSPLHQMGPGLTCIPTRSWTHLQYILYQLDHGRTSIPTGPWIHLFGHKTLDSFVHQLGPERPGPNILIHINWTLEKPFRALNFHLFTPLLSLLSFANLVLDSPLYTKWILDSPR
jgi:hypothetical protein